MSKRIRVIALTLLLLWFVEVYAIAHAGHVYGITCQQIFNPDFDQQYFCTEYDYPLHFWAMPLLFMAVLIHIFFFVMCLIPPPRRRTRRLR